VLKEPAARVFAAARKSMGVQGLAEAAPDAAAVAAAEAAAGGAAPGQRPRPQPKKAVNAAAAVAAAGARGIDGDGVAAAEADPAAWAGFCAGRLAAAAAAAGSGGGGGPAPGASYGARLQQLAPRFARVLTSALELGPRPAAAGGREQEEEQEEAEAEGPPASAASAIDDLAAGAAARAQVRRRLRPPRHLCRLRTTQEAPRIPSRPHTPTPSPVLAPAPPSLLQELRAAEGKGARMRKKKALADFYKALQEAGASKRQADVPPPERHVAAWFRAPAPELAAAALLQPADGGAAAARQPAGAPALAAAQGAAARADAYYYRGIAAVQKLWEAAKQPHRDLSGPEVQACVRYSEHLMYLLRGQRRYAAELAGRYAGLADAAAWLEELSAAAAGGGALLPPQAVAHRCLAAQKAALDELLHVAEAGRGLAAAAAAVLPAAAPERARCVAAASRLAAVAAAGADGRGALAAAARRAAGCPLVLPASADALLANCARLEAAWGEVSAFEADLAKADGEEDGEEGCGTVPGWAKAADAARRAAAHAAQCRLELQQQEGQQQEGQQGQQQQQQQQQQQRFDAELEELVKQLLLWAQTASKAGGASPANGDASSSGAPAAATAAAADAAADGLEQQQAEQPAVPEGCSMTEAAARLQAQLHAPRLAAVAAGAGRLLALLPGCGGAEQQRQRVARLAQLAPLLALLLGGVQARSLQYVWLHKACTKLGLVTASIFCSLVLEGFCVPEGQEAEGAPHPPATACLPAAAAAAAAARAAAAVCCHLSSCAAAVALPRPAGVGATAAAAPARLHARADAPTSPSPL
jgi:hypothetical protein